MIATSVAAAADDATTSATDRPRIVQRPIPFGEARKRQMRAYSRRHYGAGEHRLRSPRVIVQHFTVSDTFGSVFNTFARNAPTPSCASCRGSAPTT